MDKLSMQELNRISVEDFKESKKTNVTILLDNVRSAHNVGSVFRTSDAFRIEKILLCGITATPPNAEIHKTAIGAEQSVDYQYYKDSMEAIDIYKKMGYKVVAVEQAKQSIKITELKLDKNQKYLLVLGNEVKGVDQKIMDVCDFCIEIEQYGTKHSLNVSVCGGIVIWEFFKQLGI